MTRWTAWTNRFSGRNCWTRTTSLGPLDSSSRSCPLDAPPEAASAEARSAAPGASIPGTVWDFSTDNSVGTATSIAEDALKVNGLAKTAAPVGLFNNITTPLGVISNAISLHEDIDKGDVGHGLVHGTAVVGGSGAMTGQLLNWMIKSSAADAAGIAGAKVLAAGLSRGSLAALAFAGGVAAGDRLLDAANAHAEGDDIFHDGNNTTEEAGDIGIRARDAVDRFNIGGYQVRGQQSLGTAAGAIVAGAAGPITAARSGLERPLRESAPYRRALPERGAVWTGGSNRPVPPP